MVFVRNERPTVIELPTTVDTPFPSASDVDATDNIIFYLLLCIRFLTRETSLIKTLVVTKVSHKFLIELYNPKFHTKRANIQKLWITRKWQNLMDRSTYINPKIYGTF